MTCYFIHSGVCFSKNAIQKLKSGIWVVKRNCGCRNCNDILYTDRFCDACNLTIKAVNTQEQIDSCKKWCDRMAIVGAGWCGKVFKTLKCQAACGLAVYEIQKGCCWCCEGEGFYKRCVKPFENIGQYMKAPCDPMWD